MARTTDGNDKPTPPTPRPTRQWKHYGGCRAVRLASPGTRVPRSFSCGRLVSFVQRIGAVDADTDGAVERRQQRGFLLTQSRNGGAGPRILCSAESITCASFWATTSPFPFSFYPRGAWLRVRCHLRCFFVLATNQRTAVDGRGEALPAWSPVGMWLGERDCCPCPANGPSQTSWWLPRFRVGGRFEIAISSSPACEFVSVKFLAYGNRRSNSNSASLLATERSAFSVFLIWSLLSEQSR
jgi:hypothetical protein